MSNIKAPVSVTQLRDYTGLYRLDPCIVDADGKEVSLADIARFINDAHYAKNKRCAKGGA